ncbi:MAG TPA: immunoglobulin domain-containing protein, partial [Verrucomicrobiae bacterium]|nr:immunoglobulin domain-containing protein [Verrucomicrobiae bacterium]
FFAPDTDPTPDLAVPILSVMGLDNFSLPRPAGLHLRPANMPQQATPNGGSAPDGVSFIGSDFRKAYLPGAPNSLNGAGQIVGLFELDGYNTSDILTYESIAGIPNVPLTNVLLNSFSGSAGNNNLEVALDIEMAVAMAPALNEVIVYEGTQPNDILNQIAIDGVAKQIGCSWTWSSYPNVPPMDQIFQQMAAQGQSFYTASGDSGAYSGTIDSPADNTNVTVVGGTTLTTDAGGNWQAERVWNWFPDQAGASSGGVSTSFGIPSWQKGINMSTNLGSSVNRNIPDVALTADNIYVIANNGQALSGIGGTSAATPLWAGLTALINQQAAAAGRPLVGFVNPAIYAIGKSPAYSFLFHDITNRNNSVTSGSTNFPAVPGYDLATGWGTPMGTNLLKALGLNVPVVVVANALLTGEGCSPTNGAVDPGETVTMSFQLLNAGQVATSNLVATLQSSGGISSPSGPQNYGALTATGGSASRSFTFTANGSCGGTVTATFALQDGAASLGTASFVIPLGAASTNLIFSENFDGVTAPALPAGWTTAHTGSEANWVTSTTSHDTSPNAVFANERNRSGTSELVSPALLIPGTPARLAFRHSFNTDGGFDGGVLEMQVNGGPFQDILVAGGTFLAGEYVATLLNSSGSSLVGRDAWTGNSVGYMTTIVDLPASVAGQTVAFKWRFGTDNLVSGAGWFVDSISVSQVTYSCCNGSSADVGISQTVSANPAIVGQNFNYNLAVTNLGPSAAAGISFTDTLPPGVSFVSASPGCIYSSGTVSCSIGALASGANTNLVITVIPTNAGALTNSATISSATFDPISANNASTLVTTVDSPPVIGAQPTNRTVIAGQTATFSVFATSVPAPSYQWFFNTNIPVGGNSSGLILTNVQPAQGGTYMVVVSNVAGSTSSVPVTLTVLVPPVITNQPQSQTVVAGATVGFSVGATGSPAPGFEWLFNSSNVVSTGTNTILLTNVQSDQMGTYTAVVTNSAGTTNSVGAQLIVLVPPNLTSISVTATNVAVSFQSILGLNYTLQYKDSATAAAWNSILPATPGTGGVLTLTDTNGLPAMRIYRVNCD